MDVRVRVGRNLRRLRVGAGVTQEALAVDSRLETAHVSRIERGLANPSLRVLGQLSRALRVDVGDLFVKGPARRAQFPNLKPGRKPRRPQRSRRGAG